MLKEDTDLWSLFIEFWWFGRIHVQLSKLNSILNERKKYIQNSFMNSALTANTHESTQSAAHDKFNIEYVYIHCIPWCLVTLKNSLSDSLLSQCDSYWVFFSFIYYSIYSNMRRQSIETALVFIRQTVHFIKTKSLFHMFLLLCFVRIYISFNRLSKLI